MVKLAGLCGISTSQIYILEKSRTPTMQIDTVQKIYLGTKKHFNDPLKPYEYLEGISKEVFA